MKTDLAQESLKATPPVAVVSAGMAGYTLNDWVAIATIAYIIMQAAYLLWKWYRDYRKHK